MFNLYCLFDHVADEYQPNIMVYKNDELAKRDLTFAVNAAKNPDLMEDYSLYRIAEFSTLTGDIENCKPVMVCRCSSLLIRKENVANDSNEDE